MAWRAHEMGVFSPLWDFKSRQARNRLNSLSARHLSPAHSALAGQQ
jgi:hypothetical protein